MKSTVLKERGLTDGQGYEICLRCRARIDDVIYGPHFLQLCVPCAEMIREEERAKAEK